MVINKCGERLYKGVVDTVTAHLIGVAARVEEAAGGEALLRDLTARWDDHNKSMQMIRDILMVPPPPAPLRHLCANARVRVYLPPGIDGSIRADSVPMISLDCSAMKLFSLPAVEGVALRSRYQYGSQLT